MSDPVAILSRCHRLGLTVWAEGDRIGIAPKDNIPPGLLDEIRAAKPVLLPLVRERRVPPDQLPGLHVARQVLCGEFNGADGSTVESLYIGLRNIPHPTARAALIRLASEPLCPSAIRRETGTLGLSQ